MDKHSAFSIQHSAGAAFAILSICGSVFGQANFWLQPDPAVSQFGNITNPVVNVQVGSVIPLYIWFNKNSQALGFDGVSFDVRLQSADGGQAWAAMTLDLPTGRWDGATAGVGRTDSGGTGIDDCNAFDFTNTDTLGSTPARFAALEITGVNPGSVQLFICIGSFGVADSGQNSVLRIGFGQGLTTPEAINISGGVSGQCSLVADAIINIIAELPDFDNDNDVDQSDFGSFQNCLTGDNNPQNAPACVKARLDADSDVDSEDFMIFLGCLAGPNNTPGCIP